jgi:hypothetical protein
MGQIEEISSARELAEQEIHTLNEELNQLREDAPKPINTMVDFSSPAKAASVDRINTCMSSNGIVSSLYVTYNVLYLLKTSILNAI